MIAKLITYFAREAVVACDANCGKAWGINNRPKEQLSDDEDDYAFLADGELGEAPANPGTYEGGHAKPVTPEARLNKWCIRECERCVMSEPHGARQLIETPDFSGRRFNKRWRQAASTPEDAK